MGAFAALAGTLRGYAVVHSAHVSPYGARALDPGARPPAPRSRSTCCSWAATARDWTPPSPTTGACGSPASTSRSTGWGASARSRPTSRATGPLVVEGRSGAARRPLAGRAARPCWADGGPHPAGATPTIPLALARPRHLRGRGPGGVVVFGARGAADSPPRPPEDPRGRGPPPTRPPSPSASPCRVSRARDVGTVLLHMWAYIRDVRDAQRRPRGAPAPRAGALPGGDRPRRSASASCPACGSRGAFSRPGTTTRFEGVLVWAHWLWFLVPHSTAAYVLVFHREPLPPFPRRSSTACSTPACSSTTRSRPRRRGTPAARGRDPGRARDAPAHGRARARASGGERWGPLYSFPGEVTLWPPCPLCISPRP